MGKVAVIKASPEYLMHGTHPPSEITLCPQCRGGRVYIGKCARCGYKGPGHRYTLTEAVEVIIQP